MTLDEIESKHYGSVPLGYLVEEVQDAYTSSPSGSRQRARAAFLLAAYYERTQPNRSESLYEEAHQISTRLKDTRLLCDSLHGIAIKAFKAGDLRTVTELEERAKLLALQSHHYYRVAFCQFILGVVASLSGSYEDAIRFFEDALSIARKHDYPKLRLSLFSELAELHLMSGKHSEAKSYIEATLALSHALKFLATDPDYYIRLAAIELELKNYPRVLELVAEVRSSLPKENHSLWCVTHTLLGNVQAAKSKLKLAEAEFKSALKLADYPNCERVRSNVHVHLAGLYLRMRNKSGALKESLAALKDAEKAQDAFCRKEALRTIHDCYKALGKFKEAHRYLEKYNDLVAESDAALLKNRLEYHELRNEFEKEKLESAEKTKAADLLRLELQRKEQELTEKTRHLIKQTESLTQFRDDLRALIRRSPADDPLVHQIRERIQSLPESQLNWRDFDEQFNAVHPQFLSNLLREHPTLTATERKVCVLLRLNLTSTDIAKLLFLSERNIENHRYRIRKKLCLSSTKSLHEFLGKY